MEKKTILIIEDSITYQQALNRALTKMDCHILCASTMKEGMNIIKRAQLHLIILDLSLPDGDGKEICRNLKMDIDYRTIPLMILTMKKEEGMVMEGLEAGADSYVSKNESLDSIFRRVKELLKRSVAAKPVLRSGERDILRGKKILIIDDDITYLQGMKRQLMGEGYQVETGMSGKECLEIINKNIPDMILLDLRMPKLDGAQVCLQIRKSFHDLPVVMLTASESQEDINRCFDAGVTDYVTKNGDFRTIQSRVQAILRRRHFEDETLKIRARLSEAEHRTIEAKGEREAEKRFAAELAEKNKELEEEILARQKAEELLSRQKQDLEEANQQLAANEQQLRSVNQQLEAAKTGLEGKVKQRTKELEKANEQLRESTAQVIQAEKLSAIGEITAGVAHELNQPLNVVKVICQSILRDIAKDRFEMEDAKADLPGIITQMDRMAKIFDHMRIFSRRTTGMLEELCDINEVLENTFIFFGQQLKTRNIEVVTQYAEDLPKVKGDTIRLEQVFMNLIANARHAMEESGKEDKRLEIRTYADTDQKAVIVEIQDNGKGIPGNLKEKIFQSFFTTKEKGKGTGLGLSVSKKTIEEHKGTIEAESEIGEGTTFRIVLPIAE